MIRLDSEKPWRCGAFTMAAGTYLVGESTASTALMMNARVKVKSISNLKPRNQGPRRVALVRGGGFSDLLFLTPIIQAMKKQHPDWEIRVECWKHCQCIFDGNPHLAEVKDYPPQLDDLMFYTQIHWLEDAMEWEPRSQNEHVIDLYAKKMGVELTEGKHLEYYGHLRHLEAMRARFPKKQKRRIGIQLSASAKCRTYPAALMERLIDLLYRDKEQFEVALFDLPRKDAQKADKVARVLNLCGEKEPLSFAESTAVLADCDAVIAPDSALCHIAGALDIPTVALYGPFPWQLRTQYARSITAINGHARCAPCFHHERESVWPEGGLCRETGRCEALASIEPERIVKKIKEVMR